MPSYPSRPSSPTTLMHRLGQRPPGQIKQTLFNDMTRPVSGPVMENAGGPSRQPWMAGHHPTAVGMIPIGGETMIERFNRERGFYQGRPYQNAPSVNPPVAPDQEDPFNNPPPPHVLMPTPNGDLGLGQHVPGIGSHDIGAGQFQVPRRPLPSALPPQGIAGDSVSAMAPSNVTTPFRLGQGQLDPRGPRYMTPAEANTNKRYAGARGVPGGLYEFPAPPSPAVGGSRPALSGRLPGTPVDLSRPADQRPLEHEYVTNRPDSNDYIAGRHTYEEMAAARESLRDRNLSQLDAIGRPGPGPFSNNGLSPQQQRYVDASGEQMPLTNTRFVGRMAETPRDLSGDNGVRTYDNGLSGEAIGYIPRHGTDGSVGRSRFVEGMVRETGSGLMSIDRNPRTGGIMLSGGGRPLGESRSGDPEGFRPATAQDLQERRAAMAQSYKDTRAARAYSRNPGLANAPAVAAMRDRRNDVEYERTKTRRRDAMLEQAQMAALQQQLKGMTPAQLNEFLGGMAGRPSGGVSLGDVTEYKKSKEKENRLGWQKYFAGPATMGMHRFHQLAR